MRTAKKCKNLIAFAVVLIVLVSITAIPASAEFPPLTTGGRRLGAWILSGLTALNIALTSSISTSQGADIINFLADPLDLTYSYTEMWEDKPTIQIWNDYVTIDGTTYTDIWLSNEAAQKFKTDGLDFATAYSIASNTNGTFASGYGDFAGVTLFDIDGDVRSQTYQFPVTMYMQDTDFAMSPDFKARIRYVSSSPNYAVWAGNNNSLTGPMRKGSTSTEYIESYLGKSGNVINFYGKGNNDSTFNTLNVTNLGTLNYQPFDFDWVAGNIDATPLEPDEGIMIRVPSDTPGLQNFITNNYYLTEPTEIDVNLDPDIQGKLDDLIDIIAPILINLDSHDIQYIENHDAPAPVPDTPIVDATVNEVTSPIVNEITNYGDQITQQIPQIIETIPTIEDICNNIDTAPYHDLDTGLDKLPTVLLPFITDLRSALGIWHYVTEWLGMIGTSFAFVTGALTGTAIMTPIYAAIAGYMCIKVYRRMTG